MNSFRERRDEPVAERLQDRPRPGRAPKKRQAIQVVVREVMDKDPRRWGYRSPVWIAPLLCHHLEKEYGIEASERTIRRALRALGYRYKRPRYMLARRSPT